MGAIFFYIFIYFVGYYASNVLNMLTVRPLVTNRFMAALVPVYGIAFVHAYMVVTRPLPAGADITVEYALLVFITLPVVVVTVGAAYFMWNSKGNEEHRDSESPADSREPVDVNVAVPEAATRETTEKKSENETETAESSDIQSANETGKNKENKDA